MGGVLDVHRDDYGVYSGYVNDMTMISFSAIYLSATKTNVGDNVMDRTYHCIPKAYFTGTYVT
jgi:hypothetical protein